MSDTELKSINNFIVAANILTIISIFVLGVPLGIAAIICAVVAWKKTRALSESEQIDQKVLAYYRKRISMVLALSILVCVINAVSAYLMYPYYSEMINELINQQAASSSAGSLSFDSSGSLSSGSIWG